MGARRGGRRGARRAVVGAVIATALAIGVAPVGAQTDSEPRSTEIGVTPSTIRIAVVADVENAFAPGLFRGSVDAVRGFARFVNAHGGIAGRRLVVDFIDSRLSSSEARNAIIKACKQDFALVGTAALFLNNVDDLVGCVDRAGAPTGIPDLAVLTTDVVEACSPVTYSITVPQIVCATKDSHPQTWQGGRGPIRYYKQKLGADRHGVFLFSNDLRSAQIAGTVLARVAQAGGVRADLEAGVSSQAPQTSYTTFVRTMQDEGSNYAMSNGPVSTTIALRREARVQGLDDSKMVWDCTTACYGRQLIEAGGDAVEGQYVAMTFLPFEETRSNRALASFVRTVGRDRVDGFGAYGWGAALLFRDAVGRVVARHGVNGLTRAHLLDALATETTFDAGGMFGTTNIAGRRQTPCFALLQVRDGKYVRVHPRRPGTFDCDPRNRVEIRADLL